MTPVPAASPRPADPVPVVLPADDAAHDRLTEWWYDTGHLRAADGRRFGFEFVVFRAERGGFPVSWASHLALTDETGDAFPYAQRSEIGPQVDRSPRDGDRVRRVRVRGRRRWPDAVDDGRRRRPRRAARGGDGRRGRRGCVSGFGLDLQLTARKPAALHDGDGWIDFGPAGGSYYFSRTDMAATGTVTLGDETFAVEGDAWFDHQWGDFISVGGGGWDWFAVNLDDGTDLTLSLVRAADGTYPLVYGTLVDADGTTTNLGADDFTVDVTDHWTSPTTGATYPAGWRVRIPAQGLDIGLRPTVAQQELDTRATTGVVYWEGSQVVTATRAGTPLGGQAYVELTGYANP